MSGKDISPAAVARVLREARVRYVLVGAHAANGYTGRPRATVDVDVIVRYPKKAAGAVARAFPTLVMHDTPQVTRFMDGDTEAIDLMKADTSKLWGRLLKETREVVIGGERVRIPVLEGALAAKFAAMVSPHRRQADKLIDGGDFIRMIEANPGVDAELLGELAELLFEGAGALVLKLAGDARTGRRLEF